MGSLNLLTHLEPAFLLLREGCVASLPPSLSDKLLKWKCHDSWGRPGFCCLFSQCSLFCPGLCFWLVSLGPFIQSCSFVSFSGGSSGTALFWGITGRSHTFLSFSARPWHNFIIYGLLKIWIPIPRAGVFLFVLTSFFYLESGCLCLLIDHRKTAKHSCSVDMHLQPQICHVSFQPCVMSTRREILQDFSKRANTPWPALWGTLTAPFYQFVPSPLEKTASSSLASFSILDSRPQEA